MDLGLVGLHLKNTLIFVYYLWELNWEEQSLWSQQGPRCQNIRRKDTINVDAPGPRDRTKRGLLWLERGRGCLHDQVGGFAKSKGCPLKGFRQAA